MANNQVPADVPVVLPPEDPAPVENANAVEVPVAPQDNQEAVQGNDQQAQPLEVYITIIPLLVVLNLVSFLLFGRAAMCLSCYICVSFYNSGSGGDQNGELHIYSILAS